MANFTSTHTGAVIDAAVTKITATSSSATELNLLDGVTATTAEINILDGVTSTAAEINILDGVTSTAAEINLLDGLTATTTELNLIDGVTATTAEINYIDGVTSNIQTQLNLKAPLAGASLTGTTSFQNLSDGTITITAFADEDDFSSNSATLIPTQQSVKAYVDAEVSDNNFTTTLKNKLDAIEASATADQSNAEIRTAVEAATDSNVFTDADHSKLNAIEASADVTDTANVTSSGALMDSELTSIADVKALNQSVVSGAIPTFTTTNFTDASNKRLMTDAQETKLDSVETNADVTDTANVTSAGALMDSELTDLAGVKGVTISTLQPKPSEGAFANGDKTKLDGIEANATADQTDEEIQDIVGAMFTSTNTETGITATYQDLTGDIDLVVGTLNQDTTGNADTATKIASITNSDIVQLTSSQTLTNKTLTSPVLNTGVSGSAILDEDNMASNSATKLSSQQSIKAYVDAEVAGVVDSSPAALNTLNELAAALGDDANFSTTTSTSLGNRLRVDTASQGLTGTQQANAITNLGITATKAELNILDGVTATATELNLIDGVTATTAELNILDGVTSTAAELNILDGVTATTAELNYTDGVTSNIQTQLDATPDTGGTGLTLSGTTFNVDAAQTQITSVGTLTALQVDNVNIDGSTLTNSSGALTIVNTVDDQDIILQSDDGLGGVTPYLTLDGSQTRTNVSKDLRLDNSVNLQLGGGGNMSMSHDGSNATFSNATGNLTIQTSTDDGDVIFKCDDGSGGVTPYLTLDGSASLNILHQNTRINDSKYFYLGTDSDFSLLHNNTNAYIENTTGDLYIRNYADDKDIVFSTDDGAGGVTAYLTLDGSTTDLLLSPPGNVGIGGNTPQSRLMVTTSAESSIPAAGADSAFFNVGNLASETTNYGTMIGTLNTGNGYIQQQRFDGTATTYNLLLQPNGGSVGIGTTSPGSTLEIQKSGTTKLLITDSSSPSTTAEVEIANGVMTIGTDTGNAQSGSAIKFEVDSSEKMRIDSSGNVGIGTVSPAQKLHVAGNVMISNNQFFIGEDADGDDINLLGIHSNNNCYVGPSSNAWAGGAILYGAASTTNAHVWYEGNAERMRIADNGFLGIGTTSPGYKLDVAGDYRFKDTASGGALLGYHHNDSDNGLLLVAYGSTYSGGSTLSVGANGTAYDHTHNVGIDAGASSFIALGVGGSEKMRVHTDGSVGIGTTSPAHILDVVGTAGLSTGTAWTNTSDKRIKTNVENIENGLDKILKLRPVSFNYTEDYLKANPELSGSQRYNSFIAQEYEEVFPDAVTSEKELVVDGKVIYDDLKQFTPHDLNMYLVKAIQEMKCEIDELKLKIGE